MKTAYIFPGQGSQFPGMGKHLYDDSSVARDMFERANDILGFKISEIMFEGSDEDLKATKVTQPAIFLHSFILAATMDDFRPDVVAGHSLGEFSALAATGSISFEDGLRLVARRAAEMRKCCEYAPGAMAAIIGTDHATIDRICAETDGIVIPANYNSDMQVVISGEKAAVESACARLSEAGARRILMLPVEGAFHSPLMEPARLEFAKAIQETPVKAPSCPIFQNVPATAVADPEEIKQNMLLQLTYPVRWTEIVRNMVADGVDRFVEVGPGRTLQGLVKRIAGSGVTIEGIE